MEIELAQYLAKKQHQPYAWAINDCNTFVVEWLDLYYGTDWEGQLQFDYDDWRGAARFHKDLPFTAEEFMQMAGYDNTILPPLTGDVLLQNRGPFFCAWLVLHNTAYTMDTKQGLVVAQVNTLEDYTTWRCS